MDFIKVIEDTINKIENIDVPKQGKGIPYYFEEIIYNLDYFNSFYEVLCDQKSKDSLEWFVKFATCYCIYDVKECKKHFPPSVSDEKFIRLAEKIEEKPEYVIKDDYLDAVETWDLDIYTIKDVFQAEAGDYVLDCGTYTGNTAIKYSKDILDSGKVFGFEASPSTYEKFKNNIERLNIKNVNCYNYALFDKEGEILFSGDDIGAKVSSSDGISVPTIDIDTFVKRFNVEKVDLIKFDIEGAELKALKGARETIKKFKPKLAISAYHRPSDLIELPMFINSLDSGYDFYFRADTNLFNGFILFCIYNPNKKDNLLLSKKDIYYTEKITEFHSQLHFDKKYSDITFRKNQKNLVTMKDEYKSQRDEYKTQRDEVKKHMENFKSQRDEARELAEKYKAQRDLYKQQRDEFEEELSTKLYKKILRKLKGD